MEWKRNSLVFSHFSQKIISNITRLELSCGQNQISYQNGFCPRTLSDMNICIIASNITGIKYPGPCGCPNNCLVDSKQGNCVNGTCECNPGWKGADCSQGKVAIILLDKFNPSIKCCFVTT